MGVSTGWGEFFQYYTDELDTKLDGFWLFVPTLDRDIELFRIGSMVIGDHVRSAGATIVKDGDARIFTPGEPPIIRDPDRFRFAVGGLSITSDDPDGVFRVEGRDDAQGLAADLEVRPVAPVSWDVGAAAFYGTAIDSIVEGTITIDGETLPISGRGAFEHTRGDSAVRPPTERGFPAFWHYEYVRWDDDTGSILWHRTDEHDVIDGTSGFHLSNADGEAVAYDNYGLNYNDVSEHDGRPVPGSWDVRATRGDETFTYRATVRMIVHAPTGDAPGLCEYLLDCEGVRTGPDGETKLRGRSRTEHLVTSYNPCAAKG